MRTAAFLLLSLLSTGVAVGQRTQDSPVQKWPTGDQEEMGQSVRYFDQVGGLFLKEVLQKHEGGFYLMVRPHGTRDTLLLWVGAVGPNRAPVKEAATNADLVVWCYSTHYPDKRHPFPGTKQIFVHHYRREGKKWLAIGPVSALRKAGLAEQIPDRR